MKKLVTVVHQKNSLDYIEIGQEITFEKEPNNPHDAKAIRAYFMGQFIGYIAVSGSTIYPGTSGGHEVYDQLEEKFSGKVSAHGSASGRNTRTTLVVELESEEVGTTVTEEDKTFTFRVKGSIAKYKGKAFVLDDFREKKLKVFLGLKLDNDGKVLVTRESENEDEKLAGQIEEKELSNCSSLEDLQVIKELLQKGEDLEAKVTSASGQAYFITLTVSADVINQCHTEVAKVAIDEIKQELIAKGFKEETLTSIEDYLLENNFSAMEIQQLFSKYKVYPEAVQFRIVEQPKTMFHDDFGALKIAFASMLNNYHVLCSGDKGTGKNCFIETWAWITQRPLYSISINRDTDKLDLMGSRTIDANLDENGNVINKIAFAPEVMLEAMEVGGIINIDEINFADPGVTGLLHSICDDRRAIEVPGFRKVQADDNFCVMGTMNIDYQGTNEMNEALTDRFIDIMFPANISIFDVLVRACPDTPESEVQKADKIYQKMYSIIQDRDSSLDSSCLTVRGFIQGLQLSKVLGLKQALKVCVANKIKDDEYRVNVENIIENII